MYSSKLKYSTSLKFKIKNMIELKIRPAIVTSKSGDIKDSVNYKSSYKYVDWDKSDTHAQCIYNDLLACAHDNPEQFVHLIGYSVFKTKEYVSDVLTVYIPGTIPENIYGTESNIT